MGSRAYLVRSDQVVKYDGKRPLVIEDGGGQKARDETRVGSHGSLLMALTFRPCLMDGVDLLLHALRHRVHCE